MVQSDSFVGELEATSITTDTAQVSSIDYLSAGTANVTTVSTAASQVGNTAITWPGFDPVGGQVLAASDASGQLTWTTALTTTDPLLTVAQRIRVKQNPGIGEFLTIGGALASITDASVSKPYIVEVGPGIYNEGGLTVSPFIRVEGMNQASVVVTPTASAHTFTLQNKSSINNLTISGATSTGFAAIRGNAPGSINVSNVTVESADIAFLVDATGTDTINCETHDLLASDIANNVILCRTTGANANARFYVDGLHFGETPTSTTLIILESTGINSMLIAMGVDVTLIAGETPFGTGVLVQNSGSAKVLGSNFNQMAPGLACPAMEGPHLHLSPEWSLGV